ncbi:hypothetical protein GCM10027414_07110 [Humibacter ginsengiterrae]
MTPEQIRTEALKLSADVLTKAHGNNTRADVVISLAEVFSAYIANGAPKKAADA